MNSIIQPLKRWFRFLCYSFISFYLYIILTRPLIHRPVPGIIQDFEWLQGVLRNVSILGGFFLLIIIYYISLPFSKSISLCHLKPNSFLKFPPRWLALTIGWLIALSADFYPTSVVARGVAFLIPFVFLSRSYFRTGGTLVQNILTNSKDLQEMILNCNAEDTKSLNETYLSLKSWALSSEKPESRQEYDLLSSYRIAERINEYIDKTTKEKLGSILGLIGPFGAGKSTLINYLTPIIKKSHPDWIIVKFSCWGFNNVRSIEYQLLRRIAAEIISKIDAMQLHNLPEAWLESVFVASPWWTKPLLFWRSNILTNVNDPFEQVNSLLVEYNENLIVILEDADRKSGPDYHPTQLHKMLECLKDKSHITTIIASNQNIDVSEQLDLNRLCDHFFDISPLGADLIRKISEIFTYKLAKQDLEWDPQLAKQFTLIWSQSETYHNILSSFECANLIKTTRSLKKFCKHVIIGWDNLNGEINFFDFFLLSFTRVSLPKLMDFIVHFHSVLIQICKSKTDNYLKNFKNETVQAIKNYWKKLLEENFTPQEATVAIKIIALLYGQQVCKMLDINFSENIVSDKFYSWGWQRISHSHPTDYFRRVFIQEVPFDEFGDKQVLSLYEQGEANPKAKIFNNQSLIELLSNQPFNSKLLHLKFFINFNPKEPITILELTTKYLKHVIQNRKIHIHDEMDKIMRFLGNRSKKIIIPELEIENWLKKIMIELVSIDLYVVCHMLRIWIHYFWNIAESIPKFQADLAEKIRLVLQKKAEENAYNELWNTISGGAPDTIRDISNLCFESVSNSFTKDLICWGCAQHELRPKVLDQLVLCIGNFGSLGSYYFEEEKAKFLLGANFSDILRNMQSYQSNQFSHEDCEKIRATFGNLKTPAS